MFCDEGLQEKNFISLYIVVINDPYLLLYQVSKVMIGIGSSLSLFAYKGCTFFYKLLLKSNS